MSAAQPAQPPPAAPTAPDDAAPTGLISRLACEISDRANPIVVRYVRQQLRSRGFLIVFSVVLGLAMETSVATAAEAADGRDGAAGMTLFGLLAAIWTFAVWVFEPLNAYRAVANERDAASWDLIRLTGMSPGRVLRGVFAASVVQSLLYAASIAPFLVMAYLLRGVDLFSIAVGLVFIPLAGWCASAGAIFLGSLGSQRSIRTALAALVAVTTGLIWFISLTDWLSFGYIGGLLFQDLAGVVGLETAAGFALLWIFSMLTLGAAALRHPSANRSTGPRLLAYFAVFNWLAWSVIAAAPFAWQALTPAGTGGAVCAVGMGLFAVAEDETITPRQARQTERMPAWQLPALFAPGAPRGRLAYTVLTLVAVFIAFIPAGLDPHPGLDSGFVVTALIASYGAIILAASDLIARTWLAKAVRTAFGRRLFTLAVAGGLCFIGVVLVALDNGDSALSLVSPIPGIWIAADSPQRLAEAIYLIFALGLMSLFSLAVRGLRPTRTAQRISRDQAPG